MNDKGVHHLSRDRQTTLCGKDCAQWVFVVKTKAEGFVGDQGICPTCMEKL